MEEEKLKTLIVKITCLSVLLFLPSLWRRWYKNSARVIFLKGFLWQLAEERKTVRRRGIMMSWVTILVIFFWCRLYHYFVGSVCKISSVPLCIHRSYLPTHKLKLTGFSAVIFTYATSLYNALKLRNKKYKQMLELFWREKFTNNSHLVPSKFSSR